MRCLSRRFLALRAGRRIRQAVMAGTAALLLALAPRSTASVVTEALVDAVARIESSGGRHLVGDGGRANGAWQMHAAAWQDTTAYRQRLGLRVWSYDHAHNHAVARRYARDYLTILERQLTQAAGRKVSAELVYAAYNVGFSGLQKRGFQIERTPHSTQLACGRLSKLLAAARPASQPVRMARAR